MSQKEPENTEMTLEEIDKNILMGETTLNLLTNNIGEKIAEAVAMAVTLGRYLQLREQKREAEGE